MTGEPASIASPVPACADRLSAGMSGATERDTEVAMVSVIVPVRNEERMMARCLEAIVSQDYPRDRFEVVVADGMSTDRTRAVIASTATKGVKVRVIDNPGLGRAQGLNAAIRASSGEVIARVDARALIGQDYLSRCVRALRESGADNAGCVMKPIAEGDTQEAIGLALSTPFGIGNAEYRLGRKSGFVDQVYLGCYRREVFERVGYFDEAATVISEDSDMNQRIWAGGGTVYLDANIVTHYYPRETFGGLWNLYFRYGGARAGNFLKHRRLTSWRQGVAPLFVLTLVTLLGLGLWDDRFLALQGGELALYLLIDAVVSSRLATTRRKPALLSRLFLAFPCMHFAWALGFWKRLLTPQHPGDYWSN